MALEDAENLMEPDQEVTARNLQGFLLTVVGELKWPCLSHLECGSLGSEDLWNIDSLVQVVRAS